MIIDSGNILKKISNYDIIIPLSALSARKEVEHMDSIISFVLAIVARVVGHLICKWLDSHKSDK